MAGGAVMIQPVLEGTWEEVRSHDMELAGRRVRLTIVDDEDRRAEPADKPKGKMITWGMFPQLQALTDEDFKSAEWRGEDIDI
jgi:hypothetical protein